MLNNNKHGTWVQQTVTLMDKTVFINTSSFITSFKATNSDVPPSLEAKSLMHCLRFDRGATPQISYNNEGKTLSIRKAATMFITEVQLLANKLVQR